MFLGALLVPVGGVLIAHYFIRRPQVDEAFIAEMYNPTGSFRGVSVAGVSAWAAGAAAFFAAGSIGGTLPALAVSVLVYRALLYTARDETVALIVAAPLLAGALPRAQLRTRVVMLGTGRRMRGPDRDGPSVAIVVDERPSWISASASCGRARNVRAPPPWYLKLTRAFATHLHWITRSG